MEYWIFQANPDTFDVDACLRVAKRLLWTVNQEHLAPHMREGDRVFLWRAGGRAKGAAGIVASGWLLEAPCIQPDDPLSRPFWRPRPRTDTALRVPIDIDRVAKVRGVLQRPWLVNDPVLKTLRILRLSSETNYRVPAEHAARLEALWRNTGRDWSWQESLGGLWAYQQTYGQPVSRAADSPVAIVAQRIGRAVSGVYNKVMNFRAIDERDSRRGLEASGSVDRAVWARFYDPESRQLRSQELEAEFERLWPLGSEEEPESLPIEELVTVTSGRRGQGYISDPRVRKAVEEHAMARAAEHYRARYEALERTDKTHPFDLRCRTGQQEVRVEVKGSTGDAIEVHLTANEVANAQGGAGHRTDLFIVGRISVRPGVNGPVAQGGEVRVIERWMPANDDLQPLLFRYRVPSKSSK